MAVLQYLRTHQHGEAAASFEAALKERVDASEAPDAVASPNALDRLLDRFIEEDDAEARGKKMQLSKDEYSANFLLFWSAKGSRGDAEGYVRAYAELSQFVATSFEAYRTELFAVCWPLFVHLFIELVEKGHAHAAARLLEEHRAEHDFLRRADLHEMQRIVEPSNLWTSAFVRDLMRYKFEVRISSYAIVLLMRFLHDRSLLILVCLLNQRVKFVVEDSRPAWSSHAVLEASSSDAASSSSSSTAAAAAAAAKYRSAERLRHDKPSTDAQRMQAFEKTLSENFSQSLGGKPVDGGEDAHSPTNLPSVLFCTLLNTRGDLTGVAFAPNASRVAGTFGDATVRIWATAQGDASSLAPERSSVLVGHHGPVYAADWSGDSKHLLTAGFDGSIKLWEPPTAEQLLARHGASSGAHGGLRRGRAASADAADGLSGSAAKWDVDVERTFKWEHGPAWDVHWCTHPDFANRFASAHRDRAAIIWEVAEGRSVPFRMFCRQVKAGSYHRESVGAVRISPNANIVATGSADKSVRLWDVREERS